MTALYGFGNAATAATPKEDDGIVASATTRSFMKDVMETSLDKPVIVDFWAPWCGPCKQLTPLLEKIVRAQNGKVKLVKVNIDECPELAQQLRIQSVPMVYAFFRGQPVDGFAGMIPESQIKTFVAKLLGGDAAEIIDVAALLTQGLEALEHKRTDEAIACFEQVLTEDPESAPALSGLIRSYVQMKEFEAAEALLENVPENLQNSEHITTARKALEFARKSADQGSEVVLLREQLEVKPKDYDSAFKLAEILFGHGETEESLGILLNIATEDMAWNDNAARKKMLEFFEVLGHSHPLTIRFRKRLSSLMFA